MSATFANEYEDYVAKWTLWTVVSKFRFKISLKFRRNLHVKVVESERSKKARKRNERRNAKVDVESRN